MDEGYEGPASPRFSEEDRIRKKVSRDEPPKRNHPPEKNRMREEEKGYTIAILTEDECHENASPTYKRQRKIAEYVNAARNKMETELQSQEVQDEQLAQHQMINNSGNKARKCQKGWNRE